MMPTVVLALVLLLAVVTGEQPAKTLPSVAPAAPILPNVQAPTQAAGVPGMAPELVTSAGAIPGAPAQGIPGVLGGSSIALPTLGITQENPGTSSQSQGFVGVEAMLGELSRMGGEELGSPVPMPPMPLMPCPNLIATLQRMGNNSGSSKLHLICGKELGNVCPTMLKDLGSRPWTADAISKTCHRFGYNISHAWQDEMQDEQQETMKKLQTIMHTVVAEQNSSQISSQRLFDMEPPISAGRGQGLRASAWAALGSGCIVTAAAGVLFARGPGS
eukprot:TRINITY_DN26495_c0_g1_i2.p1 TRINITY_DN26495_c0_g1~~TRINITY_DN26495_c0_g1_i2.p1  ORF type:complete len:274 (-),score=53.66 TRINITY_DN26495_c0_g1_i2:143-964(-)